jgi:hypothetical protein
MEPLLVQIILKTAALRNDHKELLNSDMPSDDVMCLRFGLAELDLDGKTIDIPMFQVLGSNQRSRGKACLYPWLHLRI